MMTIEKRLENMERELGRQKRRNRWLLGAILLAVGGLIVPGVFETTVSGARPQTGGTAKEIRSRSIIIEDEKGMVRAMLVATKDGPVLSLSDEKGKDRTWLAVSKDGLGLVLFGENGKLRAGLTAQKNGPGLVLLDENGKSRAVLTVIDAKGPSLLLYDENENLRVGLAVTKDGPGLRLFDEKSKVIWSAIK